MSKLEAHEHLIALMLKELKKGEPGENEGQVNRKEKEKEKEKQASPSNVKTGFTPEVTPRKSGVEGGWDLASPYVVRPCLHTQWARISELVGGGDKDLSRGVNKPVGVGPSRLSE